MISLILLTFILISFKKPDILLNKKIVDNLEEKEKMCMVSNMRYIYSFVILSLELSYLARSFNSFFIIIILVVAIIFLIKVIIPKAKYNSSIIKKINNKK